jgi:dynein heavy chain
MATYIYCIVITGMHVLYNQVIHCIEEGLPLLIENLPEDIDAVMDPVLGKQTIKRGRTLILKMGDTEVEYNPSFR